MVIRDLWACVTAWIAPSSRHRQRSDPVPGLELYDGVSKSFRTDSIKKYMLTFGITRSEATQKVMAAKCTRPTHKIAIQLHLVAKSYTICSSRSRLPVRKL
jgi:hypothetical protein